MGQPWVVGATCGVPFSSSTCDTARYGTASAIRKLDTTGSKLLVARAFGGGSRGPGSGTFRDHASGIAIDANDSAWIVGQDLSGTVPTTPGAIQPKRPFPVSSELTNVGYAIKASSTGDLVYGTYLGNDHGDTITSVAVDASGTLYFALNYKVTALRQLAIIT